LDRKKAESVYERWQGGPHKDRPWVASIGKALAATDQCEEMYKEFFSDFYDETVGFIDKMGGYLAEFRNGSPTETAIQESFRLSHMVKGASATMGYRVISALSGGLESLFADVKEGTLKLSPELTDLVDETVKLIAEHLEETKKAL
jgi:chemotaxis protein histidine kinase CheA